MLLRRLTIGIIIMILSSCILVNAEDKPKKKDLYYPKMDEFVAVDKQPVAVHQEQPKYPNKLKKEGIEGTTWIKALVGYEGETIDAVIYKSSGYDEFDKSALKAAKFCTYKPALKEGKPTAIWISYRVDFKLEENK